MKIAYFDWNVFNRIEKIDSTHEDDSYSKIEASILNKSIIAPYSNAHINDLLRGYEKGKQFIPGHIATLKRMSEDLCIVQYWGEEKVTWHYRDPEEFFQEALVDPFTTSESIFDLAKTDETGLLTATLDLFRSIPFPISDLNLPLNHPFISQIFPSKEDEMNMLTLMVKSYSFFLNMRKDYSLYKSMKKYIHQASREIQQSYTGNLKEEPPHLLLNKKFNSYGPKSNLSGNPVYQLIHETYCSIDFVGHNSDDKFSNLIDDALHTFYGAHCDYFVTLDEKCYYKATETFKWLKIQTPVLRPSEFVELL